MDEVVHQKIKNFFYQFHRHNLKKGEVFVQAGDPPSGVYYLEKGLVKQYTVSLKGDEQVLNVFKPFSFFPMSWAITESVNPYFFEAIEDSTVLIAPGDKTVAFIKNNSDVLFDLLSRVFIGIEGVQRRISQLMSGTAYTRLITELIISARRYSTSSSQISLKISEKELANLTGLTRETISREIKILKDKKLVKVKQSKIEIPDLLQLQFELAKNF